MPFRAGATYLTMVVTALIGVTVLEVVEGVLLVNSPCSRLDALLREVADGWRALVERPGDCEVPDGDSD